MDLKGRSRRINDNGYFEILAPDHPNARDNWILEHRVVMENYLKRYLHPDFEVVHHVNEKKTDNRLVNLWLCTPIEHAKIHKMAKIYSPRQRAKVRKTMQQKNYKRNSLGRFS